MATSRTELIDLHPNVKINVVVTQSSHPRTNEGLSTVLSLHFWGGSARTWSHVIPSISTSYPTVAIDFRGWGNSIGPDDADAYSIKTLASDIEAVVAALRLHSVVLVGLSMGAKVAQLVAANLYSKRSGEVESVRQGAILISPAPTTPLILSAEMRAQQLSAYMSCELATFVATNVLTSSFEARELPDFVVSDMLLGNR